MVEENKDKGAIYPIKVSLREALKKQRNAMMDNFSKSFNDYPPSTHLHLATTLEAPLLSRYKKTFTFPYLRAK